MPLSRTCFSIYENRIVYSAVDCFLFLNRRAKIKVNCERKQTFFTAFIKNKKAQGNIYYHSKIVLWFNLLQNSHLKLSEQHFGRFCCISNRNVQLNVS